ncbi:hypothetical protein DPMN_061040 [Dreissena polymorpha]|uniref:Uncharacterized protein n=1 Tax=Dreissena polymorpha TaxID=45954 RepID=A0A9D4C6Q1_DREPO|nr:hypothetical protein DPMN_061040 [Dreissena polymorpha]
MSCDGNMAQSTDLFCATQDIMRKNVLTKFQEEVLTRINFPPLAAMYWTINVTFIENFPALWRTFFLPTGTIFELVQAIIGVNLLTKCHEDQTINPYKAILGKILSPPYCKDFQPTETIFELIQEIISTNLPIKFQEDRTINVASRLLTRQMLTPHNARRTMD